MTGDYDDWARLENEGWGFKDLLPYFTKHEHFDDPKDYAAKSNIPLETSYDADFHGKGGPIHTSFSTWRLPQEREWIAASTTLGRKMGSPKNAWSGDHLGTFHALSTINRSSGAMNGTRSYAVTGYLLPNAQRPNLHVLTEALASKLSITADGSVTGVEFLHSGKSYTVKAKKEVIVSAGVVKSPQILEISGIGNPAILEKAGVKCVVKNLRVGENLQDHPCTVCGYELVEGEKSVDMLQDPAEAEKAITEYMTTQSGPMSSGGSATAFASYADLASSGEIEAVQKSILTPQTGGLNDRARELIAEGLAKSTDGSIQIILLPASLNIDHVDDQVIALQPPPEQLGKQGFCIAACVQRPVSSGSCHIKNSDPQDDPTIDPGYLSHPADLELLSKGMELISRMVSTSPFKEKIKRRYNPVDSVDLSNEKTRKAFIEKHIATEYHPIGTVGMGKEGVGAVDYTLKVYGTKGLRVVDASVMPMHVSGNIQSTVYAIAEKASDMIKAEWKL